MKKTIFATAALFFLGAGIAAQTAAITAPKANDVWMLGNKETIHWNYTGNAKVRLVLFGPSGAKVGVIKAGLALSDGAFTWSVGDLEGGGAAPVAKGYRIRLRLDGSTDTLSTSAEFEIASASVIPPDPLPPPPPGGNPPAGDPPGGKKIFPRDRLRPPDPGLILPILRVSKPVDGTQVIPPIICPINWTLPGSAYDKVNIILYANGQPQWNIATNTENDGFFDWKLDGLERTGKYVVRVQTPDGKIHGDSGVVTIAANPLPPDQHKRVIARDADTLLAKSATISVKSLNCFFQDCGLATVTVKVRVDATPADGEKDFILSPDVGHPQFGSLFLRCQVEDPLFSQTGAFSVSPGYDGWISLKGGGGSLKVRQVYPQTVPGGDSQFEIVFDLKPPVPLKGQLVVHKMPRDLLGAGNVCKQYYFPKLIVTVHLVTQAGEAVDARMKYMIYSEKDCSVYAVTPPGEVTNCQEGVQDW